MTRPRLAVLTAVVSAGADHLSADEVFERVSTPDAGAHRATVYRTLEGLTDAAVLAHVHLDRGKTAYHLADADSDDNDAARSTGHLHAQCIRCRRVVDLPPDSLHSAADQIRATTGFAVDPGHVALSGLCRECIEMSGSPGGTHDEHAHSTHAHPS